MTDKPQTPAADWDARARAIAEGVVKAFQTFGAGSAPAPGNPISVWMADRPAMFAMGVNVEDVVRFVLDRAGLSERDAGWQPIERAPRDGSTVLLFLPESYAQDGVIMGYWSATHEAPEDDAWYMCVGLDGGTMIDVEVTHWRPLPSPPDPKDQQA